MPCVGVGRGGATTCLVFIVMTREVDGVMGAQDTNTTTAVYGSE